MPYSVKEENLLVNQWDDLRSPALLHPITIRQPLHPRVWIHPLLPLIVSLVYQMIIMFDSVYFNGPTNYNTLLNSQNNSLRFTSLERLPLSLRYYSWYGFARQSGVQRCSAVSFPPVVNGLVDWCASRLVRLICCRFILTASSPWSLLICRSLAIRLLIFPPLPSGRVRSDISC